MHHNEKVAVLKCPFTIRGDISGAASINIGHTISILEQECRLEGKVFYFDYNNSSFFYYSRVVAEIIEKEYDFFAELLPTERLSLIERITCERYFKVEDSIDKSLGIDFNIGTKLLEILILVYNEFIDDMVDKECTTFLIYVSPVITYQLILIDMIRKRVPNSKIIVLDDYTFEPATPYYTAIITGEDRKSCKIGDVYDKDPLIHALKSRIIDMLDIIVEGEGYDFIRGYFGSDLSENSVKGSVFDKNLRLLEQVDNLLISDYLKDKTYIVKSNRVNLDTLPFPNFEQMKELYDFAEIEFTRGCNYKCMFCERSNMMETVLSRHSVEYIVDMLKHIQKYGFEYYTNIDCCLNIDEEYTIEVLERIRDNGLRFKYQCNLRGKEPNEYLLELLQQTGCIEIAFGIETVDEDVLKSMNKEQNLEIISRLTSAVNKYNMRLMLFLIIGFPTEKREAARRTLDFIIELNRTKKINIIELEFYRPGHIQALSPGLYKQFGIEINNEIHREAIKKSSYIYAEPGFLGLATYRTGMSRVELAEVINDYVETCKANNISLATFYYKKGMSA
ncbi:MAG: B12-binding domain-containing radical SAM protein [Clostridia bacterium]